MRQQEKVRRFRCRRQRPELRRAPAATRRAGRAGARGVSCRFLLIDICSALQGVCRFSLGFCQAVWDFVVLYGVLPGLREWARVNVTTVGVLTYRGYQDVYTVTIPASRRALRTPELSEVWDFNRVSQNFFKVL